MKSMLLLFGNIRIRRERQIRQGGLSGFAIVGYLAKVTKELDYS